MTQVTTINNLFHKIVLFYRYEDITTNSARFYSLAAVYNCAIVGLLVAEIKSWTKLNKEDKTILSESLGKGSSLAYILSLGVHRKYDNSHRFQFLH